MWTETGKLLPSDGAAGDDFGEFVSISGDTAFVGAGDDDDFFSNTGSAYVFQALFMNYGSGCPGSGGFVPELRASGHPAPGGLITIELDQGLGSAPAFLLLGTQRAAIPFRGACTINVSPFLLPPGALVLPLSGNGPGNGQFSLPVVIPPGIPSVTLTMQVFVEDGGVPAGFSSTNGVEFSVP